MNVPWETIIKQFRSELGSADHASVQDYGEAFFTFVGGNRQLFPESEQEKFAYVYAAEKFARMRAAILESVENRVDNSGPVSMTDIREVIDEVIAQRVDFWDSRPRRRKVARNARRRSRERYGDQVLKARDTVFEQLPLTGRQRERLMMVTLDSWVKRPNSGNTGLVFAGFGRDDMFPTLASFEIDGVLLNAPIFWDERQASVDHDSRAVIVPFAQDDMIRLFVEGVTPVYEEFVESYFARIISGLNSIVIDETDDEKAVASLRSRLESNREILVTTLAEKLGEKRRSLYVDPMLSIVGSLPMDELASLAESLVNLTSLRRRVSLDQETVGGPIDVAVISRGDGLIWIRRKHYFPPELNHQFFANYYRRSVYRDGKEGHP
jgi:hypothetical protein